MILKNLSTWFLNMMKSIFSKKKKNSMNIKSGDKCNNYQASRDMHIKQKHDK